MMRSKAAVLRGMNLSFEVVEVEIADPIQREVLIKVESSGVCRSDHALAVNDLGIPFPRLLGHELAGVVVAVGPDVTELFVGDHVVSGVAASCGMCFECRRGQGHSCIKAGFTSRASTEPPRVTLEGEAVWAGLGLGGFAEYVLVHEAQVVAIPKDIPFDSAALLGCGVVTGVGAVTRSAQVQAGDDVAVIGVGGVGLNIVQGAKLAGARHIIAIDMHDDKLNLARELGATHTINSTSVDSPSGVMEVTGGLGVRHAFEAVGLTSTVLDGVGMLGRGGTVYLVGLQKPGAILEWPVGMMTSRTFQWEQGIRGVNMGSSNFKTEVPYLAELYRQGRLEIDKLVSRRIPLNEINDAFAQMLQGSIARAVITSF